VKGPNIPHRRPPEKTAVFAIELADAFGFLREILLRAKVDGAPFAHLLPLLGDDVISIETLPVGWSYILTQPDAAGLESLLCQFEMPLSVDWGTSVG